ncbi:MAG: hypothetical protein M3Z21_10535, partial [Pseudomonadota bacterium]|nr:hypothetical protein [Pseudomonadota bacterium]
VEHLPRRPLYVLGVRRRFGLRTEKNTARFAKMLSETLHLPGDSYVVVMERSNKALGRRIREVPGAEIFRRDAAGSTA